MKDNQSKLPVKDFVIDIETMSTMSDALILSISIGLVADNVMCVYYINTPYRKSPYHMGTNFSIEQSVIDFWIRKAPKAYNHYVDNKHKEDIEDSLTRLREFIIRERMGCTPRFWSKGSNFDFPILEHAYRAFGIEIPWEYHEIRDLRTYMDLVGVKDYSMPFVGIKHTSEYDVIHEMKLLRECLRLSSEKEK